MADLNKTLYFYRHKFAAKEKQFNKPGQLPAYFEALIGDKEEVRIAELGAGAVNTIGDSWPLVDVEIVASDIFAKEYNEFWEYHGKEPLVPIEYQDMENLTYDDESFDIVHCRNAIDHTPDLYKAISEMKRICKKGGWIYLAHAPGQKTRYGGMHYHNFEEVDLPEFDKSIDEELIVLTWQKPI